jgi:uncharacterized protein (DUF924 family)
MLLKINEINENEDGTCNIDFDADEEFVAWFKQKHKLKRWSQKRFQKFVVEMLRKSLKRKKDEQENTSTKL